MDRTINFTANKEILGAEMQKWKCPILAGVNKEKTHVHAIRQLSVEEKLSLKQIPKITSSAKERFRMFKIVELNYLDWSDYIKSLLVPRDSLEFGEMLELDRRLLNFLSSAKSLLDHFRQEWAHKNKGKTTRGDLNDFIQKIEGISWAFSFFQDLRNYTQHCGLPVASYNRSSSSTAVRIRIQADPKQLTDRYTEWGKSKLKPNDKKLDLVPLCREYFKYLHVDFGRFVASHFAPTLIPYHSFLVELSKEIGKSAPGYELTVIEKIKISGNNFSYSFSSPPGDLFEDIGISIAKGG